MGLWSAAERAVLSRYCWLHDMRQLAEAKLREQGPVQEIVTQTGSLQSQQTAFFTVAVKLHEQMLAIEREFGFTPASRTRLMVQPAEAQNDPLAAFVARRSS
jgi:P27 family predicted phage terminase small subunit